MRDFPDLQNKKRLGQPNPAVSSSEPDFAGNDAGARAVCHREDTHGGGDDAGGGGDPGAGGGGLPLLSWVDPWGDGAEGLGGGGDHQYGLQGMMIS